MSVVEGKIITMPVGIADVKQVLGSASNDLGTLCKNTNINMWAKWKPVPLSNVLGLPDELEGNDGWAGNPAYGTNKEWWFGGGAAQVRTYNVPTIEDLEDIGADGVQNQAKAWTYNHPGGGTSAPFRLTDFVGYKHDAQPPFTAMMTDKLYLNSVVSFGLLMLSDITKYEFTVDDIRDMLNLISTDKLRLAIVIRNITRGTESSAINSRLLSKDDDDSTFFNLNMGKDTAISAGGAGLQIKEGDTVDVYIFLTTSADTELMKYWRKYSVLLESTMTAYMRYTATALYRRVAVRYSFTTLHANTQPYSTMYYSFDDGDTIYSFTKVVTDISGTITVSSDDYAPAGRYSIRVKINGTINNTARTIADNELFGQDGGLGRDVTFNLAGHFSTFHFTAYSSISDLNAGRNPQTIQGIPVADSLAYWIDGASGPVSNRKMTVAAVFTSDDPYTIIDMTKVGGTDISI